MSCKRGHGPEHLYHYPDGRRVECRACSTIRQRERKGSKEYAVALIRAADAKEVVARYREWARAEVVATDLGPTVDGASRCFRVERPRWNAFLMSRGRQ